MGPASTIFMFMMMLLVAVICRPLARYVFLPFSALLVLVGFVGSELIVGAGVDIGLRWHHFHDLVLLVLLPVLIFESALNINAKLLFENLLAALVLAIPLVVLSAGVTAVLTYYGIGSASGFPWIAALLTGALLSATDPVAVLDLFRKAGVPDRLLVLVDGESLFNDATAIVLYTLLLALALDPASEITWGGAFLKFFVVFLGGGLAGAAIGGLAALMLRLISQHILQGVISLISAYTAFLVAEEIFHVSGVMAVLGAGLCISWACRNVKQAQQNAFMGELWEFNAFIANATIFLLVGMTVTVDMFQDQWVAMLVGVAAVLISRAIGIFGVIPWLRFFPGIDAIGIKYRTAMFWGGLRGAVALALALSLPLELGYWYTVQSIAYGVVLFTLFVQAPTMPVLLNALGLKAAGRD